MFAVLFRSAAPYLIEPSASFSQRSPVSTIPLPQPDTIAAPVKLFVSNSVVDDASEALAEEAVALLTVLVGAVVVLATVAGAFAVDALAAVFLTAFAEEAGAAVAESAIGDELSAVETPLAVAAVLFCEAADKGDALPVILLPALETARPILLIKEVFGVGAGCSAVIHAPSLQPFGQV